ncbi:hypothetical protein ACL9RL_09180 [Plantibacter sp. Mn2098]|uniref:hypothetical protein n=1 Tax=Plantibacter sp. Mn2098 TaxID=3395266 RepID=UPI003BC67CDE
MDLIPLSTVTATLGVQVDPEPIQADAQFRDARFIATDSVGGLACLWGTGRLNAAALASRVYVAVVPDAAADWERYAPVVQTDSSGSSNTEIVCDPLGSGAAQSHACTATMLVGAAWVETRLSGVGTGEGLTGQQAECRVDELLAALAASLTPVAASPREIWTGVAGTQALPAACDEMVSSDAATDVLDLGTEISVTDDQDRWYLLESSAAAAAGTLRCSFMLAQTENGVSAGTLIAARGGAWGYDLVRRYVAAEGPLETVSIDGIPRENAFIVCSEDDSCEVNLSVRGNWIQLTVWQTDEHPLTAADMRDRSIALAATVVGNLRA